MISFAINASLNSSQKMTKTILIEYTKSINQKISKPIKITPQSFRSIKSDVRLSVHPQIYNKFLNQSEPKTTFDFFNIMNQRSLLTIRINQSKISRFEVFLKVNEYFYEKVQIQRKKFT